MKYSVNIKGRAKKKTQENPKVFVKDCLSKHKNYL